MLTRPSASSRGVLPTDGEHLDGRDRSPNKTLQIEGVKPDRILNVAYGFWLSKALFSAVELDLFTVLAQGPLEVEPIMSRTGLHQRGARDFLDALVAIGLLERDAVNRYANRPDADLYLDRRKPTFIGGLLEHLNARHYHNWSLLTRALRTGVPQSGALATGSYPALYADTSARDIFLNGMTAGSLLAARALAAKFPWGRYRTFIDVGTAQGCVPVEIVAAHSHLTGGGFDLPEVELEFTDYVRKHGFSDRLRFHIGDFFTDPLPPADVLVMGRILHNWDLPTRKMLIEKAYRALPQQGAVIVYDPLIENDRCSKAHGLLSSLNMLIETSGGFEYTSEECIGWMQEAGFCAMRTEPLDGIHTAVIGFKTRPSGKGI